MEVQNIFGLQDNGLAKHRIVRLHKKQWHLGHTQCLRLHKKKERNNLNNHLKT